MTKLKPQLIVAGPSKRKGGFASGVGYFLVLIIVFVLGVYLGMKIDNPNFEEGQLAQVTQDSSSSTQTVANEPSERTVEVSKAKDTYTESDNAATEDVSAGPTISDSQYTNSRLAASNEAQNANDPNSPILIGSNEQTKAGLSNGSTSIETNTLELGLIDLDSYRLQVAAFGNIDHANEVVNDLRLKGYDAYIVTTSNSRGEVWNLIKVGQFSTANEAWNYSTIFKSQVGGEVFVESLNKGRVYNQTFEDSNDTL